MLKHSFKFPVGKKISNKYEIIAPLGGGWEGEVYHVRELATGIDRAAKFFYPENNKNNKVAQRYARKLFKLRHSKIVIQYLSQELIQVRNQAVTCFISELVDGVILKDFLSAQKGKRMSPFEALHFLYALCLGLEEIHRLKEYHGDLHEENIMIARKGISFEIKILDFYSWDHVQSKRRNIQDDIFDAIKLFYDCLGGRKYYSRASQEIKQIVYGLKKTLIVQHFSSSTELRQHLENFVWE